MKPNNEENQERSGIGGYTPFSMDSRAIKKPKPPPKKPPQQEERDAQYKRLPELSKPDFDPRRLFPHKFENPAPRPSAQPHQPPRQAYPNSGGGDVRPQHPHDGYGYRHPKPRCQNPPAEAFGYSRFPSPQDDVPKEPPQFPDPRINEYKQFPPLRDPNARNYRVRKSQQGLSKSDAQGKTFNGNAPQNDPQAKNTAGNRPLNDPQAKNSNGQRAQGEPRAKVARGLPKGDPRAAVGSNKPQPIADQPQPQVDTRSNIFAGNKPQDDPKSIGNRGDSRPPRQQGDSRSQKPQDLKPHKPQGDFKPHKPQGDPRPHKFQSDPRPHKQQDNYNPYRQQVGQKHYQPMDDSNPHRPQGPHKPQGDPNTQKPQGDRRSRKPHGDPRYHKQQDDRFYKAQDDPKPQGNFRPHVPQDDPRFCKPQDDPRNHPPQGDPRFYTPQDDPRSYNQQGDGRFYKPYGDPTQDDPRLYNPNDDSQSNKGDPRHYKPQSDYRAYKQHDDPRLYNPEDDSKSYKPQGDPRANKPGDFKYNKPQGDAKAVGSNRPQAPIGTNRPQGPSGSNKPQGDSKGAKPQGDSKGAKPQGDPRGAKPKGTPRGGGDKNQSDAARLMGSKAHQELKAQLLAGTKITKSLSEREKRLLIEDLANDLQRLMREAREAASPEPHIEPPRPAETPIHSRADSICRTCTGKTSFYEPQFPPPMPQVPVVVNVEPVREPAREPVPTPVTSEELVAMNNSRNTSSDSSLQELRSLWRNMPRTAPAAPVREQCHVLFDPEFEKWKDPPPEEETQDQAAALDPTRRPQYWVDFDLKKEIGQPLVVYNMGHIDNNKEMRVAPKWVHPDFKLEQRRNEPRGKEQEDKQGENQGAKKKRPYSAQPRGAPTPCTSAHNTVAIYTVHNSVPPVCSVHATSEQKVLHTTTTTVAYMTPTHSPERYSQAPPPVYPASGYTPVYPPGYPYPPTTHSQPYYVPVNNPEHVAPHQVYGAYQQISQSHYYPQGYAEHHYVSQYRGSQPGWYYPAQRYPAVYVPVHPGNNFTQFTRSERVFIQSNRMEVRTPNANTPQENVQPNAGNYYMMKCPLPTERPAAPKEPSVQITEIEDEPDNVSHCSQGSQGSHGSPENSQRSKGSSSIVVEDEKESISDAASQSGSFESNSSEYAECQVLYEADPDAIRMEDLNEREWQPFVLPDANPAPMNYPLERSPAVANMRDLYTIREEDERSRASTRGSPRPNESPRLVHQGFVVVTTTPPMGFPPAYSYRRFR